MDPYRRDDGTWMVPSTYRDPDRDITATGYTPLTPDHPQYTEWKEWIDSEGPDAWASRTAQQIAN